MTRCMYALLESKVSWWVRLKITPQVRHELEFWMACMANYNCQPVWHSPSAVRVIYADASDTGYGRYVVEHGDCVAYSQWTEHEAQHSSTWRELTAVLKGFYVRSRQTQEFPYSGSRIIKLLLVSC